MVGRMTKSPSAPASAPSGGYRRHDDFVPYLLNYVVSLMNVEFQAVLRRYRLPFRQWRVLAFLQDQDRMPIGQLASQTATDQTTLSRIITQMENHGLVVRQVRPEDNRFVEIFLTDRGRSTFESILPVALALRDRYLAGFDPAETEALVASLRKIVANIEPPC